MTLPEAMSGLASVELFELTGNVGYFGAAKAGLERFLERQGAVPDWVIVCNNDVHIEDRDFFSRLFEQESSAIGVLAPRIHALPARIDQNPFMRHRLSWLRWAVLRFIYSHYGIAAFWDWLSRGKQQAKSYWEGSRMNSAVSRDVKREPIYAPHGSFFIFSRRYFEAGGCLDGNLFLGGEEVSVAETCRSLCLPVVYEPSLRVLHNEHTCTGKRISRFSYECHRNALRYVRSRYLSGAGGPVESGTEPQALVFLRK